MPSGGEEDRLALLLARQKERFNIVHAMVKKRAYRSQNKVGESRARKASLEGGDQRESSILRGRE